MPTALGDPAWVGTAYHTDYGGHEEKANWFARGTNNPQSDVGAAAIMRQADLAAALTRAAPFAALLYRTNDAAPAAPTVQSALLQTGVRTTEYAGGSPPAGFPTLARNGDGDVTVTFSSSYADAYGTSADLDLQFIVVTPNDEAAPYETVWERVNAYTIRVRCYNANTGAAAQDIRISLWVK